MSSPQAIRKRKELLCISGSEETRVDVRCKYAADSDWWAPFPIVFVQSLLDIHHYNDVDSGGGYNSAH